MLNHRKSFLAVACALAFGVSLIGTTAYAQIPGLSGTGTIGATSTTGTSATASSTGSTGTKAAGSMTPGAPNTGTGGTAPLTAALLVGSGLATLMGAVYLKRNEARG